MLQQNLHNELSITYIAKRTQNYYSLMLQNLQKEKDTQNFKGTCYQYKNIHYTIKATLNPLQIKAAKSIIMIIYH